MGRRHSYEYRGIVKMLLDEGAEVNTRDDAPLMRAVQRGDEELVKLLLDRGAEVAVVNKRNKTPLSLATKKGNKNIITLIQKKLQGTRHQNRIPGPNTSSCKLLGGRESTAGC